MDNEARQSETQHVIKTNLIHDVSDINVLLVKTINLMICFHLKKVYTRKVVNYLSFFTCCISLFYFVVDLYMHIYIYYGW